MKIYIGLVYILFEATKTLNTKNILMLTEIYIYFQSIINLKIQKKRNTEKLLSLFASIM